MGAEVGKRVQTSGGVFGRLGVVVVFEVTGRHGAGGQARVICVLGVIGRIFVFGVLWVLGDAGRAVGDRFKVLSGFRKHERLAGEGSEASKAIVARLRERVVGIMGGDMTQARDQREVVGGIGGVGFEPALDDLAGLVRRTELSGGVALAGAALTSSRNEAHDDSGAPVHDAEVGLIFGEVARWRRSLYGVIHGPVATRFKPGAQGMHEV